MEDIDMLIQKVESEGSKTRDEIKSMMEQRKEKTHGLLSDYGAIYAVAKELGIELSENQTQTTSIKDIKPQSSINLAARVKQVYPIKEFERKDGSTGRLASLIVLDKTGEIRVVLWDNNSSVSSKIKVNDVVLLKNALAKENRGQTEVHAGSLTNITLNPKAGGEDIPEIKEEVQDIGNLSESMNAVSIIARVNQYYPMQEFERKDGSTGKRASFIAQDKTSTIRVVLWDEMAEKEIEQGDTLKITNAYTRAGLSGGVELQVGSRASVEKTDADLGLAEIPKPEEKKLKVDQIQDNMRGFTVEARILKHYGLREYSQGTMASVVLGDSTGTIRAVFWSETSEEAGKLSEGDTVRLVNVYSKANMNDEPEIHVGRYAKVEKAEDVEVPTSAEINDSLAKQKNIADLESADNFVKIKGKIQDFEQRPIVYMTCDECSKKVQNIGGEWMCEECGVVEGTPNMIVSTLIEDETGIIRAVAFKESAEKILGFELEEALNIAGEEGDENAPLKKALEKRKGKDVQVIGRVNYNDFSDQLEFVVSEVI